MQFKVGSTVSCKDLILIDSGQRKKNASSYVRLSLTLNLCNRIIKVLKYIVFKKTLT